MPKMSYSAGDFAPRLFCPPSTLYYDLSDTEKAKLSELNETLKVIENRFHSIALQLCAEMDARVSSPDDWLDDYEVELEVNLYLDENDPAWNEDSDNILITLDEYLKHVEPQPDFGFGAINRNHAEFPKEGDELHCWLYHCLYDHAHLDWRDLLRVARIDVDMMVTHQAMPKKWG